MNCLAHLNSCLLNLFSFKILTSLETLCPLQNDQEEFKIIKGSKIFGISRNGFLVVYSRNRVPQNSWSSACVFTVFYCEVTVFLVSLFRDSNYSERENRILSDVSWKITWKRECWRNNHVLCPKEKYIIHRKNGRK